MAAPPFDIAIIGGGINAAAIARDAAGLGLSVFLAEQRDLASATSSASTKLIHGGLRYLEHYEFGLVRKALAEREVMLAIAPHIARPLRFVLPHERGTRPAMMIRAGLFLYDHLARRPTLKGTEVIKLASSPIGAALKPEFKLAFAYSDVWVDDSRLVVLTALDAGERGAVIRTRTRVTSARRDGGRWIIDLSGPGGAGETVSARVLVNAAGPWVGDVLRSELGLASPRSVRLVKGSHIVVPRLYAGEHAFIFQNRDRRVVFAIPYEGDFTLIGTTDVPFADDPAAPRASEEEIGYLCEAVSAYFRVPVARSAVRSTYAGVRALFDDGHAAASEVTRDYALEIDAAQGAAPILSVYGGKITTHRALAVEALDRLRPHFPGLAGEWTHRAPLPGGDLPGGDVRGYALSVLERWPFLSAATALRVARAYGTRLERFLGSARASGDLGRDFGAGLTEAELRHLRDVEWATTGEDVLFRRSKLGLHLNQAQIAEVGRWMDANVGRPVAAT